MECVAVIGKSTDAAITAEVMIERAVLLREDHDVFNIRDLGATGWGGRNYFGEAASMQTETCEFCHGCSASEFEHLPASKYVHGAVSSMPLP